MSNPFIVLVETFNGVDIYLNQDTGVYSFTYGNIPYTGYSTQYGAELAVSRVAGSGVTLSDWINPADTNHKIVDYYRGVPLYGSTEYFSSGGSSGYKYFWHLENGAYVAYSEAGVGGTYPHINVNLESAIDGLLGPVSTAPPVITPPGGTTPPTTTTVSVPAGQEWWAGPFNWLYDRLKDLANTFIKPIQDDIHNLSTWLNSISKSVSDAETEIAKVGSGIENIPGSIAKSISDSTSTMVQNVMTEALKELQGILPDSVANSPEWKQQLEATLNPYATKLVDSLTQVFDTSKYAHSPITPEEAVNDLKTIFGTVITSEIMLFISATALEGATVGQVEALFEFETLVLSKLGLNQITSAYITIPVEELIIKKVRAYYAKQYTPEIPPYADIQNMRMKEIIGQNDFTDTLGYLGFAPDWADKLWSAHFAPPTLTDIITAYRRQIEVSYPKSDPATGTIVWIGPKVLDLSDVRYLLESIDLDPRYMEIFLTRIYNDVPLSYARWMWETGALKTRDEVLTIVRKQGVDPLYENAVVDMVIGFAVRTYRRRYWAALQMALTKGAITEADVKAGIADNPPDAGIDYWMIKTANTRKLIATQGTTATGQKLLALGDLKKAYINNLMDVDALRTELGMRNYQISEIDLLIKVLDMDRIDITSGKKVVALSPAEIVNAWRYGVYDEERVRTELMVRGLSLEEVNTLIATKKAQWGVAAQQQP